MLPRVEARDRRPRHGRTDARRPGTARLRRRGSGGGAGARRAADAAAAEAAAAARPRRRAQRLRRDPRRHRRRGVGAVRRRPAAHVPALRGTPALADGDRLRQRIRPRRLQGGDRAHRRGRRVFAIEVRVGRAPRAARPRNRGAGAHPHVGVHGRRATRGRRTRRDRDRPRRDPRGRLPLVRRGRPAREQDRIGGADHAPAHRHRRRMPGRPLAAPQPRSRDEGARRAAEGPARERGAGARGGAAQVAGRLGRPLRAHPHLQLPAGPRHRPPHQSHAVPAAAGDGRRPRRAARRAVGRAPGALLAELGEDAA